MDMIGHVGSRGVIKARSGCAVLVVDDDELVRVSVAWGLKRAGYDVRTAASGSEALQELSRTDCRVVISDWDMPDMDGLSLCRCIRERQQGNDIYVLLLTVRSSGADILNGLQAGADDYLLKGTPEEELLARVDRGRRTVGWDGAEVSVSARQHPARTKPQRRRLPPFALGARLERQYRVCRRDGAPIALVACDLDAFADICGRFGKSVAEAAVRAVCRDVAPMLLWSDWMRRRGNGEFVVVLPHRGLDAACVIAEKIRRCVRGQAGTAIGEFAVTVSIGVAAVESREDLRSHRWTDVLRTAEHCLLLSRIGGGDRVTFAPVQSSQVKVTGE